MSFSLDAYSLLDRRYLLCTAVGTNPPLFGAGPENSAAFLLEELARRPQKLMASRHVIHRMT